MRINLAGGVSFDRSTDISWSIRLMDHQLLRLELVVAMFAADAPIPMLLGPDQDRADLQE